METLGQRIKSLRKAKGYSQQKLMKLVGIGQASISKLETNKSAMALGSTIAKMAEALGVSPEFLLTGQVKSAVGTEKEVLTIYRAIDPAYIEAWLDMGRLWKRKVKAKATKSV
jgi:transcriptional regulator with XRE-family HTH domain